MSTTVRAVTCTAHMWRRLRLMGNQHDSNIGDLLIQHFQRAKINTLDDRSNLYAAGHRQQVQFKPSSHDQTCCWPCGVSYSSSYRPAAFLLTDCSFQLQRMRSPMRFSIASGSILRPLRNDPTVWPLGFSGKRGSRGGPGFCRQAS